MKRFRLFIYPYSLEGLSSSAIDYYRGSFRTLSDAIKASPIVLDGYGEILKTVQDGSLRLVQSGFQKEDEWVWLSPEPTGT